MTEPASFKTNQETADWNQVCSEEHLARIAASIVDWRAVSPFLGLTEAEEVTILGTSPHSVLAQKISMLRRWKQKRGAKGTYKRLSKEFRKCCLLDLEEKVKELLTECSASDEGDHNTIESHCIESVLALTLAHPAGYRVDY